jgi:hypothetical protein
MTVKNDDTITSEKTRAKLQLYASSTWGAKQYGGGATDQRTNGPTGTNGNQRGPTDQRMDKVSYRGAMLALKTVIVIQFFDPCILKRVALRYGVFYRAKRLEIALGVMI